MSKSSCEPMPKIEGLEILYRAPAELAPQARNPRTHSLKQIKQLEESIKVFGFTNPILLDDDLNVLAGHGRLTAAKNIGLPTVPTIKLSSLSEAQKRAYIIADNKLAENAGWDKDLLSIEFGYLNELDLDFDLTVTGFDLPEIDLFTLPNATDELDDDPSSIAVPEHPITKLGDIWRLGDHLIICGDARNADTYKALLGDAQADLVFTDPPYNVPIDGHVCGSGSIKHEEFVMASGEMSSQQFTDFLSETFARLIEYSRDGSIHYIFMDWRHILEVLTAGKRYTELKNLCVWNKTNGGMGSLYRSKHELVFVYKNGTASHINNVQLGQYGRYRTNVWDYAGITSFHEDRMNELSSHPTVKPVSLVVDALLDCSHQGDIILDCFGGSGTTLIAAEKTARKARLIEMDPRYVDVTIRRYQKLTGQQATHAITNELFPIQEDHHER